MSSAEHTVTLPDGWSRAHSQLWDGPSIALIDDSGAVRGDYRWQRLSYRSGARSGHWMVGGLSFPSEQACIDYIVKREGLA